MLTVRQKKNRLKELRAKQPELFASMVRHPCPSCGRIRKTAISTGVHTKQTMCRGCGTEYGLTRDMHTTGLHKKVVN